MKVAVIGPSKKFISGVSYYTIYLSNALSKYSNVKAILFRNMLPRKLFPGWKRVGRKDITNLDFNKKVKVFEVLDWYNPLSWLRAFNVGRDCDVIILQWWTSSVAHMHMSLELAYREFSKVPIIIEFHEVVDPLENSIAPLKIYSRVVGTIVRSLANLYVVHSHSDKHSICDIYKIPDDQVYVIPHGVYDHYTRVSQHLAKKILGLNEDFVILFFGLIRPYKGVKYLIKAFEELPNNILDNSRLLIVGEIWEDKEIEKLVTNSPYSHRIKLINDYVPDSEISLYFSASDVVVLPYLRASQSGVAHTAMVFGLPIIATPVGGLKESLSKYRGTIFVPPKNVKELTQAIELVYNSTKRRYNMPLDLKWDTIAKKWMKLIRSL